MDDFTDAKLITNGKICLLMNAREKVIIIKQLVDTWTMDQLIKAETTDEARLDQLLSLIVKK